MTVNSFRLIPNRFSNIATYTLKTMVAVMYFHQIGVVKKCMTKSLYRTHFNQKTYEPIPVGSNIRDPRGCQIQTCSVNIRRKYLRATVINT